MRAIKQKLNSQRGASLTFALLIFLVCAVVGSVVLTAGTAASGRMSQIAEMDQRYYSVNSAARLLIDMIDGEEVKVVKTETVNAEGQATESYKYYVNGKEVSVVGGSFPSLTIEAAYQMAQKTPTGINQPRQFSITTALDRDGADLAVTAEQTVSGDGSMVFKIWNTKETQKYVINVRFAARKQQGPEPNVTTVKWKLSEIETVRAKPTDSGD